MLAVLRTPERLRGMAEDLEREARALRSQAQALEQRAGRDQEIARRKSRIRRAAEQIARGADRDATAAQLARDLESTTGDILAVLHHEACRYRTLGKIRRNREIMRLAQLGWTNDEIGGQFDLHPKHISRIVQGTLKSARWLRSP